MAGAHQGASGRVINAQSVAQGGGVLTADIVTAGFAELTVLAIETATATGADLVLGVRPYQDDGVTILRQALTATSSTTPVVATGTPDSVITSQTFELRGIPKVQVQVTNNNAFAAKNATVEYFLLD